MFLAFFEDDFFYYLVIAKHFAAEGVSSFNGIQLTNGYHPLWFTTIVLAVRIFGDHTSLFVALTCLIWLLLCGTYRALRRTQDLMGLPEGLALPFAIYSAAFTALVSRSGMEVSLALFLLVKFWQRMARQSIENQSPGAAFGSGLIASLVVLSRVDALLALIAYAGLTFAKPATARRIAVQRLLWFGLGLFPVALYALTNRLQFGVFFPMSGIAKNLKVGFTPLSGSTLHSLLEPRLMNACFTWPAICLAALFLRQLRSKHERIKLFVGTKGRVQLSILLHPLLFYTVLSFTSDWPLFTWYLYPLVPIGALLAPTVMAEWVRSPVSVRRLTTAVVIISLVSLVGLAKAPAWNGFIYREARDLQVFAASHPGRYAMGAGAGTPAYLMTSPVIQMEGLTGDVAYLDRLRRREPLEKTLGELRVDYYVTLFAHPTTSCFLIREPEEAGPRSPAIKGHLCSPAAAFRRSGDLDLLIFDVRELQRTSPIAVESR